MTDAGSSATERSTIDGSPFVLGLFGDLMLSVRVEATARALGYALQTANTLEALQSAGPHLRPTAVVIDLAVPGFPLAQTLATLAAAAAAPPVLAFFPHVEKELGRAARDAGCTIVVPRSRFMADMSALLRRAVEGEPLSLTEQAGDYGR